MIAGGSWASCQHSQAAFGNRPVPRTGLGTPTLWLKL